MSAFLRLVGAIKNAPKILSGLSKLKATLGKVDEVADATRSSAKSLGKSCSNSFVSGTQVLMGDGSPRAIEDIEIGERVLAWDPLTGEQGAKIVTNTVTASGNRTLIDIIQVASSFDALIENDSLRQPQIAPREVYIHQWQRASSGRNGHRDSRASLLGARARTRQWTSSA
ncbi:MAG: hypothetical protein KDB22_29010 [Planctomycetales bacterium]|nr:hypothetical protein [Planctomycetales bacterium]